MNNWRKLASKPWGSHQVQTLAQELVKRTQNGSETAAPRD